MSKKIAALFLAAVLLVITAPAGADRLPEERPDGYIGAMRVVWCKEWVSLREAPKKTSDRLAQIPLGDIVYSCVPTKDPRFYKCEYQGQEGYVLSGYLIPAPECEPPLSSAVKKKMTMEELKGNGEIVLDWKDYNMSVVAVRDHVQENKRKWEVLRVGCFIDGTPVWGHEEKVEEGQLERLKVFIGGVQDDWKVMLYDGGYGLSMLDLLSGKEKWTLSVANCPLGDAAAVAVDKNGTMYVAGSDGPDPVAITLGGRVLWKSDISDPNVFGPFEIALEDSKVLVKYRCGLTDEYRMVTLDSNGGLVSIGNQKAETAPTEAE